MEKFLSAIKKVLNLKKIQIFLSKETSQMFMSKNYVEIQWKKLLTSHKISKKIIQKNPKKNMKNSKK